MMVEAVLCDINGVELMEESRQEAYIMKSVKCRTVRGAGTSTRLSRVD